jgi:hypothetical protein
MIPFRRRSFSIGSLTATVNEDGDLVTVAPYDQSKGSDAAWDLSRGLCRLWAAIQLVVRRKQAVVRQQTSPCPVEPNEKGHA